MPHCYIEQGNHQHMAAWGAQCEDVLPEKQRQTHAPNTPRTTTRTWQAKRNNKSKQCRTHSSSN